MKMIAGKAVFETTGKELYCHGEIIGLSEFSNDLSYGYDGDFASRSDLTNDEIKELSDYMINLWTAWRLG